MNAEVRLIESPESPELTKLCRRLRESSSLGTTQDVAQRNVSWPKEQLDWVGKSGVYRWFVPTEMGGLEWSGADIVSGYIQMAAACLTTTFIVTQRVAAIRRICASPNLELRQCLLPGVLTGASPATVGISHLTTSRRHIGQPVLSAEKTGSGYRIDGYSPWVTGGEGAEYLVLGAELADGKQILFALPVDSPGVLVEPGFDLVALTGSRTGPVKCSNVAVDERSLLAGPMDNVLSLTGTPSTGSLQTSALATGLTQAAIEFIEGESIQRPGLRPTLEALKDQQHELRERLLGLADGHPVCTNEQLRTDANSLVLRSTQAAMVAAKGTGYLKGHPVGRWCQEALFFLVWSCPQSVLDANLCELAGIE